MEHILFVILATAAVCAALFVLIALSPAVTRRLIAGAGTVAVVCGFLFYGYCFASINENSLLAVIRTCYAVFLQFLGEGPYEILSGEDVLQQVVPQIILNTLCFLGVFTTAGAAISAIGGNFLRKLRLHLQWKRNIAIIQPLNSQTLDFARELIQQKNLLVVFADSNPDPAYEESAHELGAMVRSDEDALDGTVAFIRSLGIRRGGRSLFLFALSDDHFSNRQYACHLLDALQQQGIPQDQSNLTIFANESDTQNTILSQDGSYTYGSLLCVSPEQLAARLLMHKAPLWETISFNEDGSAAQDLHALVVGSGKVGQAVIKQLVMNGQFAGSEFTLTVFDPNYSAVSGQLRHESRQIFENYNIRTLDYDARSNEMYDFLEENAAMLKYVVLCTGDDGTNREVARQLNHYLASQGNDLPIYICSRRGLQRITATDVEHWDIYCSQVLCSDDMDKLAMLLNHSYCGNDKTPRENWEDCDYFSRMSSRASADYAPAFLKMAGLPADTVPSGQWCTPEQLENMAISEHERWNAFHFCMGFRAMTEEEYADRCRIYREEKAKNPASRYRIGKDVPKRIHSCLIPWEELDALSARENAVTGGKVDYKQMDRNNVLTLPALLESAAK